MSQTNALDSNYNNAIGDALKQSTGGSSMDKEAFLMLLVTQFKYQDPLNPMEDKEFVAQLAQFSALEQSMQMNENLTNMLTLQSQQTTIAASNYIGKEVSARGYGVALKEGKASLVQYATSEPTSKMHVNILDSSTNAVVATVELGSTGTGIQDFYWNGKDNNGNTVKDGVYTVAFVAYNEAGERILVDTSVSGVVNGVSYYNGEHYLRLDDGRTVQLSSVREILQTKPEEDPKEDTSGENKPAETREARVRGLMDDVDKIMDNAQQTQTVWNSAKDKLAALLGG